MKYHFTALKSVLVLGATVLAGISPASAEFVVGVTSTGTLISFDSASPTSITTVGPVTGLGGASILGIDYRPAEGAVFALGSNSQVFKLNLTTAVATAVGSGFSPPALSGTAFGFDFNPMIDRIRIVSDADQNLVVNPFTGALQLDATTLAYVAGDANVGTNPNVVDSAYTNNFVGTGSTQLFGIDSSLNILVTQANNAGTLGTVGSLTVDPTAVGGFDISGFSNTGFAALTVGGVTGFYSINLTTGQATSLGAIGTGTVGLVGLTVVPEPSSFGLIAGALAAFGFMARRRRRVLA